ncbi:TPA: hypothetical protein L4R50_000207 [Pseudomonas aeruginosa]|nr:hypothetical protein [Pseudomonas aeruginosa]HBP1602110.1 hypothetical protein [Pseudomonas aeruginosa]
MSAIYALALTAAAHNHVAIEDSEQESLDLFRRLKAMAEKDSETQIISLGAEPIPSAYDYMTVGELVAMIESEASQLVAFAKTVLSAAHQGLQVAAARTGFERDEARWDFNMLAEDHLQAQATR